jgi:hypothetical protein
MGPFALCFDKEGSLRGSHEKRRAKLALVAKDCQYEGVGDGEESVIE